jgi:hypothetical protein
VLSNNLLKQPFGKRLGQKQPMERKNIGSNTIISYKAKQVQAKQVQAKQVQAKQVQAKQVQAKQVQAKQVGPKTTNIVK